MEYVCNLIAVFCVYCAATRFAFFVKGSWYRTIILIFAPAVAIIDRLYGFERGRQP